MAAPDGGEDRAPLALDIGPVRVKAGLEPRFPEDPLAGGDLTGDGHGDPDTDGDETKIRYDLHGTAPEPFWQQKVGGAEASARN
jgi:hypothetical protein